MEPFDLAVGLWPVRPSELRGDSSVGERAAPESRSVARSVVGDDAFDGYSELVVERVRPDSEPDSGDGLFVRMDLGVDDSGSIIER